MARPLLLLTVLAAVAPSRTPAQDIEGPKWTPLSFSVGRPAGDGARAVFDLQQGTRVVARLELPGQKIVTINSAKSKAESFADDRGTDLLAAPVGRGLLGVPAVSGEHADGITFHVSGCPAKGATRVRIKGHVMVLVGRGEKEAEKKDADLKAGIDLGFGELKVQAFRTPGGGLQPRPSTSISFNGTKPLTAVTLLDADGKEIPCRFSPLYQPFAPADGKIRHRAAVTVPDRKLERCTVRVKHFDTVEEVKVPFDLEVGPGL